MSGLHNVSSTTPSRLAERQVEDLAAAQARFWAKVQMGRAGDCWLWRASVGRNGYGQFTWASRYGRQRPVGAHRVAYELTRGLIVGEAMLVCHTCDTPLCVNPSHLFLGTQTDNMQDASAKGRLARKAEA